jgi:hypothetical protein
MFSICSRRNCSPLRFFPLMSSAAMLDSCSCVRLVWSRTWLRAKVRRRAQARELFFEAVALADTCQDSPPAFAVNLPFYTLTRHGKILLNQYTTNNLIDSHHIVGTTYSVRRQICLEFLQHGARRRHERQERVGRFSTDQFLG